MSEFAIAAMSLPVMERKRTRISPQAAVAWALICVVAAIWLFPVAWILLTSLKTPDEIALPTPRLFFTPTVGNYARAWFDYKFGAGLANSFIAAGGATVITLIVGTLAAYGLTRFPIRGARHIALTILSLRMMPPISVVLPYYTIFQKLHLLDTLVGLILIYLTTCLPFAIWLLYGFVREVPRAIDEAAMLDEIDLPSSIRAAFSRSGRGARSMIGQVICLSPNSLAARRSIFTTLPSRRALLSFAIRRGTEFSLWRSTRRLRACAQWSGNS